LLFLEKKIIKRIKMQPSLPVSSNLVKRSVANPSLPTETQSTNSQTTQSVSHVNCDSSQNNLIPSGTLPPLPSLGTSYATHSDSSPPEKRTFVTKESALKIDIIASAVSLKN